MKTRHTIAAAAVVALAAACSPDEPMTSENSLQGTEASGPAQPLPVWFIGTVHRLPDSGAWVVRTAGGTEYQPSGLPEEFQVEGLAVEVEARKLDKVVTEDTLGGTIDIVQIRKRGSNSG